MNTKKILFSLLSIPLLFSSCLGDDNNNASSTYNTDLAFTQVDATYGIYAGTSYGYFITSPEIQAASLNKCYIIGYTVSSSGATSSGVYNAESVTLKEGPFTATSLKATVPPTDDNSIPVSSFSLSYGNPIKTYLQDNWLFTTTLKKTTGENVRAEFFYDRNNQIENGEPIGKNKVIIDVRIYKDGEGIGTETNTASYVAGNFSGLRNWLDVDYDTSATYTFVFVKFRYQKIDTEGKITTESIGSWTLGNGAYYMGFTTSN